MKGVIIIINLLAVTMFLIEIMENPFNVFPPFALLVIFALNTYYILEYKKDWSDRLLKKGFFKKKKLLKVFLIPVFVFFLALSTLSPSIRSIYTDPSSPFRIIAKTGIEYTFTNPKFEIKNWGYLFDVSRQKLFYKCSVRDDFGSKNACEKVAKKARQNHKYVPLSACVNNCTYNKYCKISCSEDK